MPDLFWLELNVRSLHIAVVPAGTELAGHVGPFGVCVIGGRTDTVVVVLDDVLVVVVGVDVAVDVVEAVVVVVLMEVDVELDVDDWVGA